MDKEKSKLDDASDALQLLACSKDDSNLSKKRIIQQLKKDIVAARSAGKGWKEIVDAIKNAGIDVSCAYLRAVIKVRKRKPVDIKEKKIEEKVQNIATPLEAPVAVRKGENVVRPDTVDL